MIKDFIPVSNINRPNRPNTMSSITIHNTDNTEKGANAKAHAKHIKNITDKTSWHYTVDDKEIYQHIPDNEASYHTNNREGNDTSIAIEICVNSDGNLLKATNNAVELCRELMKKHGIKTLKRHYDWSDKYCPRNLMNGQPYSWNEFIEKVKNMTKQEAKDIVQKATELSAKTIEYIAEDYKYGEEAIIRIAKAIQGK
jgi:N-acetylmuramoyl-L-alanine amidase